MPERMIIAVPTSGEGGLDCERSAHFGHCDCFTLVDVEGGQIAGASALANPAHEEGGCLRPVELLAAQDVDAIVVIGMGARPLAGFQSAGISVYLENESRLVGDAVKHLLGGGVDVMGAESSCGCH